MSSESASASVKIDSYNLAADGIRATILSWGGVLQSLVVRDREGKERDVVVGFEDPYEYTRQRSFNGSVIGRYANRINKGRFTVDGKEYSVPTNEGANSLHGGKKGYDHVNWTLVARDDKSVTLSYLDKEEVEGFPGDVLNHITYTLATSPARLTVRLVSLSLDKRTPIMPTTHTFFTLSGFQTPDVLDDTLHLPNASRVIMGDEELIPTGELLDVKAASKSQNGSAHWLDYTSARQIASTARDAEFSPTGPGIDHAYIFVVDPPKSALSTSTNADAPVQLQWSNPTTGIRMTLKTNQHGLQIYTAKHHDGTTPVKSSQKGGPSESIQRFGCIAVEPQDWIDGINNPAWGREQRQVLGPEDGPNVNWAEYAFDTV